MAGLIIAFWFIRGGIALRYLVGGRISTEKQTAVLTCMQVLFIGVMSCLYVLWDVIGTRVYFSLCWRGI